MDASDLGPFQSALEAVAFAARAHRGQSRKDGITPYVSHVFRVTLIVRQVFGVDDPNVLAAAVLHDTLEDTATDYDDLSERFGPEVANWAASLSKDMRLPENRREEAYRSVLARAPWQVRVIKLADMLDNLWDSGQLPPEKRKTTLARLQTYLDALAVDLPDSLRTPWDLVREVLRRNESSPAVVNGSK